MRFIEKSVTFLLGFLACSSVQGLDSAAIAQIDSLAIGERIELSDMPIGGERRATVEFERVALYAEGAQVVVVAEGRYRTLPRDDRIFLVGTSAADPRARVALAGTRGAVGSWRGGLYGASGFEEIRFYQDAGRRFSRAYSVEDLQPEGVELDSACMNSEIDALSGPGDPSVARAAAVNSRGGVLRLGVLAIDTDKEWLDRRFSDDVTAAADYKEELMLIANGLFEVELNLRLQLGNVFLRVGSDPYPDADSGAGEAELREFGSYWEDNYSGIERTHAAMISGRSNSPNSASGIAWVNSYCRYQSGGGSYSYSQLFRNRNFGPSRSAGLFTHELGHNLGSQHTHCYEPPIDQCFNSQSGCYSGPVSCPSGGSGTLMSYCHFGSACGGSIQLEFAPRVMNRINGRIAENFPSCITEDTGLFADRFEG